MRRLFILATFLAAGCSGTDAVTSTSSSGNGFGGIGGIGGIGAGNGAGSGSGSTGAAVGNTGASSGAVASTSTVTGVGSTGNANTTNGSTGTTAANASTGTTSSGTTATTVTTATASSSSGSTCIGINQYAGIGATDCCSGLVVSSAGYCEPPAGSTSSTNGTGTSGSTGTSGNGVGTTTGGPCPMNLPNLETGQTTTVGGTCSDTGDSNCPTGFSCINHQCILHGSTGPLQVTMSWDDPEDLDLHVFEPQAGQDAGYCEIFYGNVGNREFTDGGPDANNSDTSICTPIGWLDRDSNPACSFDNVDIENVIYPYSGNPPPPSGTYTALADYYEDCVGMSDPDAGIEIIPEEDPVLYAIQIRRNGAVYKYCRSFSPSDADGSWTCDPNPDGGSASGFGGTCYIVDTFTYP